MKRKLLIQEARKSLRISQTELGKQVGVTQTIISAIENGLITVRPSHRSEWEQVLQQPPGSIHFPD